MTYNRTIQLIALVLCVAFFATSAVFVFPLADNERGNIKEAGFRNFKADQSATSTLAIAALATFRGVAVDYFWMRANDMKEKGQYWEANQLAEFITDLQPRFPQVWAFHAWNMAYNISVATHTQEERWDWVKKGIVLLRDRGIPSNPGAVRLYKELGWIFFHKVGQFSDDMHWYYKKQLALEWQTILGQQTEGETYKNVVADFKKIADAPDDLATLIANNPGTAEKPGVEDVLKKLEHILPEYKRDNPDSNYKLMLTLGGVIMFNDYPDVTFIGINLSPDDEKIRQILLDPKLGPPFQLLVSYLRKYVLVHHYHMEPDFMLKVMKPKDEGGFEFGPMDWRHPAAHATYWAAKGVEMAPEGAGIRDTQFDILNTQRGAIHGTQEMMFRGRIVFNPFSMDIDYMPDPRFIDAYEKAYFKGVERLDADKRGKGAKDSFAAGYENFLQTSIVYAYIYGDEEQAAALYAKARDRFGTFGNNDGRYLKPLDIFVLDEMKGNSDLMANARQLIDGFILNAMNQGLAAGRMNVFNKFVGIAHRVYETFMKGKPANNGMQGQERMSFPPFEVLLNQSYLNFMRNSSINAILRARAWANTPIEIRLATYDELRPAIVKQVSALGYNPDLFLPEPQGIVEYRKLHPIKAPEKAGKLGITQIETR